MRFNRRGLLAAVFAFLYPGLGHVYLRAWLRAVGWFVLALLAAALVVPESAYAAYESGGFEALYSVSQEFGTDVFVSLLGIRVLNVIDAYLTAIRQTRDAEEQDAQGSCPSCGKELDEELDFCPWCTTRLDEYETEDEANETDEDPALWQ